MDKRIYDKVSSQFTGVQIFSSELGTQYIMFNHDSVKYIISASRDYVVTMDGNYIAGGAKPDEILIIIDFIIRGERYPISNLTREIADITGFSVAY